MIEAYKINLLQMMENAGRCLAILAQNFFLDSKSKGQKVAVLAGSGGNGGGAMVAARRLASWGADVAVFVSRKEENTQTTQTQYSILEKMKVDLKTWQELPLDAEFKLIIDGIIGYSLKGDPLGAPEKMIQWTNSQHSKVLSLDVPSGIELSTGTIGNPSIAADATMTLALPKKGLYGSGVIDYRGDLFLADISVPPALYSSPTLALDFENPFMESDIVKLN